MRYLLFTLIITLAGCVTASTSTIPGMSFDSRSKDHPVSVYASEVPSGMSDIQHIDSMPKSGTVIGHVNVNGAEAASWNSVISTAKNKARRMGGDAIVVEKWGYVPVTSYAHSWSATGGMTVPVTSNTKGLVGRVVRFNY